MMRTFEYVHVVWGARDDPVAIGHLLNDLGAQGWEAVGLAPQATTAPMPGMGARPVSDLIVLLKREISP